MKYLLLILAVLGVIVSSLALREHYRAYGDSPCSINERWDCGVVNHSPYAMRFGIPIAVFGIAGYILTGVLAYLRSYRLLLVPTFAGLALFALPREHRSQRARRVVHLLRYFAGNHLADVAPHPRNRRRAVRAQAERGGGIIPVQKLVRRSSKYD